MKIQELGHVVLYVTNLRRSVHFYNKILGFGLVAKSKGVAAFSSGRTHHELLLIEIGNKPKSGKLEVGLYHIGFKIGNSLKDLHDALNVLEENNVEVTGASDHTVSKSLYLKDPDGNELELYVDVTDSWKKNPKLVLSPIKPLRLD